MVTLINNDNPSKNQEFRNLADAQFYFRNKNIEIGVEFYDENDDNCHLIEVEEEIEITFTEQVNGILLPLNFQKSNNNSWYFSNGKMTIRISDHASNPDNGQVDYYFEISDISEFETNFKLANVISQIS